MNKLMRIRASASALMDPKAAARNPSAEDIAIRDRAVIALGITWAGAWIIFLCFAFVNTWADVRGPIEIVGIPGVAALVTVIICRDPRRRDFSLQGLIFTATGFAAMAATIILLTGPGAALGVYWALVLACVLACWGLYWHWRTR